VWLGNARTARRIGVMIVIGLLVIQPFFSLPVRALKPDAIVINEFSIQPGWVELYNTTGAAVDLTNWQLQTTGQNTVISGMLPSYGFLTFDLSLDSQQDTLLLKDDAGATINTVAYGSGTSLSPPSALESTARRADGGVVWAIGVPTKGVSNKTDFLPPSVPVGGSPNNTVKTTHAFTFTWDAVADDTGPVSYEFRMANQPEELGSKFVSGVEGTSIDFRANPDAADGVWYWQVRAVDQSQNYGAWSDIWQVRVDTNGPGIIIENPNEGTLFGGPQTKEILFQATIIGSPEGALATLELDGTNVSDHMTTVHDEQSNLHVSAKFDADALADGEHIFLLGAADEVGNVGQQTRRFVIDTSPPELLTNVDEGEVLSGSVRLTLTAEEAHPGEYGVTIERDGEVVPLEAGADATAASAFLYMWDTTAVTNGVYTLRFYGIDAAGNESVLIRTVRVNNEPGGGSLIVTQPLPADPLLEQLSRQLTQPFVLPEPLNLTPAETTTMTDEVSDLTSRAAPILPVTDQNAKLVAAVAPTEAGWRIFGVLWYWWFLLILTVAVTLRRVRKKQLSLFSDSAV